MFLKQEQLMNIKPLPLYEHYPLRLCSQHVPNGNIICRDCRRDVLLFFFFFFKEWLMLLFSENAGGQSFLFPPHLFVAFSKHVSLNK